MKWLAAIQFLFPFIGNAELPPHVLNAIHQVESSGKFRGVRDGDGGRAIGPFQIHKSYWRDAIRFQPSLGGRYGDCQDYHYAKRVVTAYLQGWAAKHIRLRNWEAVIRTHNGGPDGSINKLTLPYWERARKFL
jgi:hypothetical protein